MKHPARAQFDAARFVELLESRIAPAAAVIELSSFDGTNGFRISGGSEAALLGISLSDAGDVNNDGFDDVIIGANKGGFPGSIGESYVVFGKADGFSANFDLAGLNGTNGFRVNGAVIEDQFGLSVSGAGDINGDGFADVIIGAAAAPSDGTGAGAAYVLFGRSSGFPATINVSSLDPGAGFKIIGQTGDRVGYSVAGAVDVNGDGFDDVIIGAPQFGQGATAGATYVVFGHPGGFPSSFNVSSLDGTNGFKVAAAGAAQYAGTRVNRAGDVNGDGFDDVLIGQPGGDAASYLIFGKGGVFPTQIQLSALNGTNGLKLTTPAPDDWAGKAFNTAGDVNGDGFDDVIVGAYKAKPNGDDSGAAYVMFGHANPFPAAFDLASLNGANGFKLNGVAEADFTGRAVSTAGDINGDGLADILVGAPGASSEGPDTGAAYLVYGRTSGFPAALNLSALDGSNGFVLEGGAPGDKAGYATSTGGDVNGDGLDDLFIGASHAAGFRGAAYVVFGQTSAFRVSDAVVLEGDAGSTAMQFVVSLSVPSAAEVRVDIETMGGSATAGSDFSPLAKTTFTFAPGEREKTVTINVAGDTLHESDETFSLVLSDPSGAVIADAAGVGTIRNDDAPPSLSVEGASVLEGDQGSTMAAFTVRLSSPSGLPVTVQFATADETALASEDYLPVPASTLTFAPGETVKLVEVAVFGDTSIEDHENFSLSLSQPAGATIGTGTARAAILNDDTRLSIGSRADAEGNSGTTEFLFNVNLEKASAQPVTVSYATADGSATSGIDYMPVASGTLVFAPGEISKTISVQVMGDDVYEGDETFSVNLSNGTGAELGDAQGEGTIVNDEMLPTVRISDFSLLEGVRGRSDAVFTVTLSRASSEPISVQYATADATASATSDYGARELSMLVFSPGTVSQTIVVEVKGDTAVEADENFFVNLSAPVNATLSDSEGEATIFNDDLEVTISKDGTRARFNDVDGDRVLVKTTVGQLVAENFLFSADGTWQLLDLRAPEMLDGPFNADVAITATTPPDGGGDGFVNLRGIDGSGLKLKSVKVDGALGQIDLGEGVPGKSALKVLTVQSLGPGAAPDDESTIAGRLGAFKAKGDLTGILHVTGGAQDASANIRSFALNQAVIGGNIDGGAGGARAGLIEIAGGIGGVIVKGNVNGGAALSGILAGGPIGTILIGGNLSSADPDRPVTISALGTVGATSAAEGLALARLSIGGGVLHAQMLAGYARDLTPSNGTASIGTIDVAGTWNASSAVAGVADVTGDGFGRNDAPISTGATSLLAKIARLTIHGGAAGSMRSDDHFGITAQQLGRVIAGSIRPQLTPDANDFLLDPLNNDLRVVDFG